MENEFKKYKKGIAKYLGVQEENIFLFWKGRVALYSILKAMDVGSGDEVILPAFTCVVVPNAIIYLGAKPVYVDIDKDTYNIRTDLIQSKITGKTKLIIAQNTFGLSPDINGISAIAKDNNIEWIEDCTHGFGGSYEGHPNGTLAKASFFSTQWNKPFSTGIGGFCYVSDKEISLRVGSLESAALRPSFKEEYLLKVLLFARKHLMGNAVYWTMLDLYRKLSKLNIIIGSSDKEELGKPSLLEDFLKGSSKTQAREGIKALAFLDADINKRINMANAYNSFLAKLGVKPVESKNALHTFLKYPLLVSDRNRFMELARMERIAVGDWFISPLHPNKSNFEWWNYTYGENPVAEYISAHIVNLPTGPELNDHELKRVLNFLDKNQDLLIKEN
jgi:perosamine synthetase